jgi:hypothetical protein
VWRASVSLLSFLCLSCGAATQRRAEDHLRNELNFFVPYVDLDAEERATREVLAQRNLVIDEEARGEHFRALSASSLDHKRSAVRIITQRGVSVAEDADADDFFALAKVGLVTLASRGTLSETLVGVTKTTRGQDAGCLTLYRVASDGRLSPVELRVESFGSRACVGSLLPVEKASFDAVVVWPTLSAGVTPHLTVELKPVTPPLNAPPAQPLVLRLAETSNWFDSAAHELAEGEARPSFAERQARAVALAALALARNEGVAQQLGAYRAGLGGARAGTAEADVMAGTVAHIEHGWSDPEPDPDEQDATRIEPPEVEASGSASEQSPVASPPPAPDDVVIEPNAHP